MASELRPLLALPFVLCALAASLALRTAYQPAHAATTDVATPVPAGDGWRVPPAFPKADPAAENSGFLVAYVKPGRSVTLRSDPAGRVLTSLGAQTQFGSARALSVVRSRRGRWLGVTTPELANGRLGWIDARSGSLRYSQAQVEVEVDLSRRELLLRHGAELVRRLPVSIGRGGSPTPIGRFAVTDKLPGARYSSVYGCCILALSGTQPNLPPGWTGGNRLAIHGTTDQGSVGRPASAGCLHARDADLRVLMKRVPLGAPVRIHA